MGVGGRKLFAIKKAIAVAWCYVLDTENQQE
jgi:hypothetical protein